MLVTDMAMRDMTERNESFLRRVVQALLHPFRIEDAVLAYQAETSSPAKTGVPPQTVVMRQQDAEHPLRKHPCLRRVELPAEPVPVNLAARRARAAGVRAILLARESRFDEARSAFHAAALADETLDLSDIAGFWDMSRRGMFAAIQAYEDLERYRDASTLEAQIRRTYRPRVMAASSSVSSLPPSKAASGR